MYFITVAKLSAVAGNFKLKKKCIHYDVSVTIVDCFMESYEFVFYKSKYILNVKRT